MVIRQRTACSASFVVNLGYLSSTLHTEKESASYEVKGEDFSIARELSVIEQPTISHVHLFAGNFGEELVSRVAFKDGLPSDEGQAAVLRQVDFQTVRKNRLR